MGEYSAYRGRNTHGPDATANNIILKRRYPGNELLAFLIVEGETDRTFYRTVINRDKCQISVAHNKSAVIQVMSILEKDGLPGVLAIVDADFDVLEKKTLASVNVLLTDAHDLEMMILKSAALEKVLYELGSEDKIDRLRDAGRDVRSILLECSIPVGYLRYVSLRDALALKFEELDFAHLVDRERLTLDSSKLVRMINARSSMRQSRTDAELLMKIQSVKDDAHDRWHVCCGHDLIGVLSVGLRKALGSCQANDARPDILERSLRLAYERAYFDKTQLYVSIKQWETVNQPFVILG